MTNLTDFADWLSPVLVKELRQGMRARAFVISFILLQVVMVWITLLSLDASAKGTGSIAPAFWTVIGVPVLLVMPLAAMNAIGGEKRGNTLELITLTHLSTRRVVLGKWLAVLLQSILLVCAVLPYAVLRYYVGGVNIGQELLLLFMLLFISAIFTALAVGISPLPALISRAVLIGGLIFGGWSVPMLAFYLSFRGMGGSVIDFEAWETWVGMVVLTATLIVLPLEFGAGQVARPAENHSTPIRIIALGLLVQGTLFLRLGHSVGASVGGPMLGLVAMIIVGLTGELPRMLHSIYRPFVRWGLPGRLAGRLLHPGWAGSVWLAVLLAGALFWALLPYTNLRTEPIELAVVVFLALGAYVFPLAIVVWVEPWYKRPLVSLLLVEAAILVMGGMIAALEPGEDTILSAVPPFSFIYAASEMAGSKGWEVAPIAGGCALTMLALGAVALKMLQVERQIRPLEKQAAEYNAAERNAPATKELAV